MILTSRYNGALLFGDTKLLVVDNKTNAPESVSLIDVSRPKNKYRSYYKGLKGEFTRVISPDIPKYEYKIILSNDIGFSCGSNHKAMVYRTKDKIERTPSELLAIEFIYNDPKDIYIPWKNLYKDEGAVDISYVSIKSITREENTDEKPVYGIVFKQKSPSVLLMLGNGVVIRGDKETRDNIINVKSKNTVS